MSINRKIADLIRKNYADELDSYATSYCMGETERDNFVYWFDFFKGNKISSDEWYAIGVNYHDYKTWRKIVAIATILSEQAIEAFYIMSKYS